MARFTGQRVVITGAGSGFGAATAARFAAEGARVILSDIHAQGIETVAAEIQAAGGECQTNICNVAEEDAVVALMAQAVDSYGGVDVLVNNAGYSHHQKLLWKISVEDFDAVFAVNVRGVFLGCKHVIPLMIEGGG
ncbi:MAG: SDR family NAD(P)-dependent oxidoreductase, partial [Pseudomonadota bacterium]